MRVLFLTGATGFLGSELARGAAARQWIVHALRRTAGSGDPVAAAWHAGALEDAVAVERAVAAAAATASARGLPLDVIHCGALISYRTGDAARARAANVEGTANVIAAARRAGVRRLVHVSSIVTVAHSRADHALDETAPFNGADLGVDYVTTKRAAEESALAADGLEVVVVNPGAIFGITTRPSNSRALLERVIAGSAPPFAPPGGTSVLGVEDAATGTLAALDHGRPGRRYVLAERYLRHHELLAAVARLAGKRGPLVHAPRVAWPLAISSVRLIDRVRPLRLLPPQALTMLGLHWNLDATRARRELGWFPRPFTEVLSSIVARLSAP